LGEETITKGEKGGKGETVTEEGGGKSSKGSSVVTVIPIGE